MGIFYIKKGNGTELDSYYDTIEVLISLFEDAEFNEVVNGYYINNSGSVNSVRVSYFVNELSISKARSKFKQFINKNGLSETQTEELPEKKILALLCGGFKLEERFRNYLVLETKIGLDLMQRDLLDAKRLFATYRWQIRKASLSFKKHFEPIFIRNSQTYNLLSNEERDQFFEDIQEWPNHQQLDWAHFMVNLVLGRDWNKEIVAINYITPGKPLSIPEINEIIKSFGFQIPLDWSPRL